MLFSFTSCRQWLFGIAFVLLAHSLNDFSARANPNGGTVRQGTAAFNPSGSQLTVTTSDRAFISWQSFNIGLGETTTFVQPSASSLVWNQINDPNPSQILGNLNANGYVILQNRSGFYIGGQASITTHGLMMTTSPIPMPDLSSGGAWQFSALPPAASIINYGQINIDGGSAFLIAHDIENHGSITAPGGNIGLYAGKKVLVSSRPDGRGLSALVTLPEGSVDNTGNLIADAGSIALHAQVVNQGGLVQANSIQNRNGVIELIASDSLSLGAASVTSAKGDSTGTSPGGFVVLKSGNTFAETLTSAITVAGNSGGHDGIVEVFGNGVAANTLQSSIDNHFALLINPFDITLSASPTAVASSNPNFNVSDLSSYSKIALYANDNIALNTLWNIADSGDLSASLNLNAEKNIILSSSAIRAGNNWSVTLSAGPRNLLAKPTTARTDGIYLDGNSVIDVLNGNVNLWAANEVIVNSGAIRTRQGGSISVTAQFGSVNTGVNNNGYLFGQANAPFYVVNSANLGGISTAAGGDVTINAGGDVTGFTPVQTSTASDYNNAKFDAGTGAFGSQHGNVTITAGGNVFGHYVLANGVGTITAGGNIGQPIKDNQGRNTDGKKGFALSLVKGSWNVSAPNGNIYVQDVRNPNGIFGEKAAGNTSYAGYHLFDYDPLASVHFRAGNSVEFTGLLAPHTPGSASIGNPIPFILPPTLEVIAGGGGFVMNKSLALFPSPYGNLDITTLNGGDFVGILNFGSPTTLIMLGGNNIFWSGSRPVNTGYGSAPVELNNPNPVKITVSGSLKWVDIMTTKATHLTVGGDLIDGGFSGQNLHSSDITSIDVAGKMFNTPGLHFVPLAAGIVSANSLRPDDWNSVFALAVDPDLIGADTRTQLGGKSLDQYVQNARLFGVNGKSNPSFVYDPATLRLGYNGDMSGLTAADINALKGPITVVVVDSKGLPVIDPNTGRIQTKQYTFIPTTTTYDPISALQLASKGAPVSDARPGYAVRGPGKFNINADTMDLGNSRGVISFGGAAINLNLASDLTMLTSRIASYAGGNVTVNSSGGSLDLGSQNLIIGSSSDAYGIYTSGKSDVSVTAHGNVNINGSRIATYNGGNVFVESFFGDVNVGSGGNTYVTVPLVGGPSPTAQIYGSGILAVSLPNIYKTSGGGTQPGNITVQTPRGNIASSQAGILQIALNGSVAGGPTVTLNAGTPASGGTPAIPGNIDLGDSGLIGGAVSVTAQGNINGLIISRQNSSISAAQNFSGTLLSAGTANVSAGGTVAGTVIGVGGANVSGTVTADVLGQNVSVNGGSAESTLGTSASATATSQSAANQASTDTKEQIATNTEDDDEKKKKGKGPGITRRTSRVTVVLPSKS